MKVLMFGRGVVASIYGRVLAQAGHEVEFLVRPGRAAHYGPTVEAELRDGRRGRGLGGERTRTSWPFRLRESLAPGDGFDLIVLSVGHHRLPEAAELLGPRIGGATVLVFGNLWADPETAAAPIPLDQLVWGFPQAGGAFDADGVLHGGLFRSVVMGRLGFASAAREDEVRAVFRSAGLTISEKRDLRAWLQLHFAMNVGMHAQGVRLGSLSEMIGRPDSFRDALRTAGEMLPVLRARGVDLRRHRLATVAYRHPVVAGGLMSAATSRVPMARTAVQTHTERGAEEPRRILQDALAEARRLGIATPRLEAAVALIPA